MAEAYNATRNQRADTMLTDGELGALDQVRALYGGISRSAALRMLMLNSLPAALGGAPDGQVGLAVQTARLQLRSRVDA